jgi:hypothetical protein
MDLKYDIDRSLGEILKRGENLSRKKHRRSACIFGTLSGITAAIIAVVFYGAADFSGTDLVSSTYGAFLLSREAGAYVLIAVIFFVLGICISLGVMRLNKKRRPAFAANENRKGGKSI